MAQMSNDQKSPRVDMTPMVDLGFLLITFFMLATAFSSPKSIKMTMPAEPSDIEDYAPLKCSQSLTLFLTATDYVKHYTCPESGAVDSFAFSPRALRDLLLKRRLEVENQWGKAEKLVVLLKLDPSARYQRLVDAIDEMHITQTSFVLTKPEAGEF